MAARLNNSSLGAFSRLPAEIRNEIFRMAQTAKNPIVVECHKRILSSRESTKMLYSTKGPFVLKGYITTTNPLAIKPCVKRGLGAGIILACKMMHREAIAMLYHHNTFVLESVLAIGWFLHTVGDNLKTLTRIDTRAAHFIDHARQLMPVRRMKNLEYLGVGTIVLRGRHRDWTGCNAAALAKKTWEVIKPIVAYREEDTKTKGVPLSTDLIKLSKEEQLQRLSVFHFEVSHKTSFRDIDGDGNPQQRFKELVVDQCISQSSEEQSRESISTLRGDNSSLPSRDHAVVVLAQ